MTRHVTADPHSEFRVEGLPAGSTHLSVNAGGFATASSDVNILVSSTQEVTVTLRISSVRQTAGVSATPSSITTQPIDADSNVHQSIVTSGDLEALPLPARSFANIAYLAAGTEPVEPSDPTRSAA